MLASAGHLVYERISRCQEQLGFFASERIALMEKRMRRPAACRAYRVWFPLIIVLGCNPSSQAQTNANKSSGMTPLERRASLSLKAARSNPLDLRNLLFKMPKGADLHNHLYGALYAESWIRDAAEDHLCIDPAAIPGTKPVFSPADDPQSHSCSNGKMQRPRAKRRRTRFARQGRQAQN